MSMYIQKIYLLISFALIVDFKYWMEAFKAMRLIRALSSVGQASKDARRSANCADCRNRRVRMGA